DRTKGPVFNLHLSKFHSKVALESTDGLRHIMVMLHQAQNDLRMRTSGPLSVAVGQGRVYDYFEEIRKIVELATEEVLFVDAYLDADVVSRYLTQVKAGVDIRLLTGDKRKLATLLPAIDLFVQQQG